jgi:hypothetical protein
VTLQDHIRITFGVSILTIFAMGFVTEIVLPLQGAIFPNLGTLAALIMPIHGIRVLCAWMYGWWSVIYLFVSNIATALFYWLIASNAPHIEFTFERLMAWALVSVVAIISFSALTLTGLEITSIKEKINNKTWRQLILVAIISSVLNSLGHTFIFSGQFVVVGERNAILTYIIGDTLGTVVCFAVLIVLFRFVRLRMTIS